MQSCEIRISFSASHRRAATCKTLDCREPRRFEWVLHATRSASSLSPSSNNHNSRGQIWSAPVGGISFRAPSPPPSTPDVFATAIMKNLVPYARRRRLTTLISLSQSVGARVLTWRFFPDAHPGDAHSFCPWRLVYKILIYLSAPPITIKIQLKQVSGPIPRRVIAQTFLLRSTFSAFLFAWVADLISSARDAVRAALLLWKFASFDTRHGCDNERDECKLASECAMAEFAFFLSRLWCNYTPLVTSAIVVDSFARW